MYETNSHRERRFSFAFGGSRYTSVWSSPKLWLTRILKSLASFLNAHTTVIVNIACNTISAVPELQEIFGVQKQVANDKSCKANHFFSSPSTTAAPVQSIFGSDCFRWRWVCLCLLPHIFIMILVIFNIVIVIIIWKSKTQRSRWTSHFLPLFDGIEHSNLHSNKHSDTFEGGG